MVSVPERRIKIRDYWNNGKEKREAKVYKTRRKGRKKMVIEAKE